MNPEVAIDIFKSTVIFALWVVAPFLLTMLVIGLLMSLFQSVTSLQEQSLTFTPKLLAMAALSMLLAPWLLRTLSEFTITTISRIATLGH